MPPGEPSLGGLLLWAAGVTACLLQNEPASQPALPLKQENLRRHSESESEEGVANPIVGWRLVAWVGPETA